MKCTAEIHTLTLDVISIVMVSSGDTAHDKFRPWKEP